MARTCTRQLVAKRRSSTRVGRKHPAPSALARAAEAVRPSPVPSDYSPPFLVDGLICRLMTPPNAQPEVQQWAGAYWQPSLIPMYRLSSRTPVSRALLADDATWQCLRDEMARAEARSYPRYSANQVLWLAEHSFQGRARRGLWRVVGRVALATTGEATFGEAA